MPRMSKKRREEWSFFLNERNRITFNSLCRRCTHDCKQSFRAMVIICPHYESKRTKAAQKNKDGFSPYHPRGPTDRKPHISQKGADR